jgi:hypothetical protein
VVKMAASWMGKHVHLWRANGAQEALRLIAVGVEVTVDSGHHAVNLEAFSFWHIEGAVFENLDLESMKQVVVLSVPVVPVLDSPALETDPFPIEPRRDLEAT